MIDKKETTQPSPDSRRLAPRLRPKVEEELISPKRAITKLKINITTETIKNAFINPPVKF
jgi:hypothetical protein